MLSKLMPVRKKGKQTVDVLQLHLQCFVSFIENKMISLIYMLRLSSFVKKKKTRSKYGKIVTNINSSSWEHG